MQRAPINGTDYDEAGLPMLVGFDDNPPSVVPPADTVPRDKDQPCPSSLHQAPQ